MSHQYRESWVDRQIREAQERGEFDNLPGAGKPLGDLGDPNDPDWWVRRYIEREQLDVSGALPAPLMLRKEAASFPDSLAEVRTEAEVREILEDFNRRVKVDRLRPAAAGRRRRSWCSGCSACCRRRCTASSPGSSIDGARSARSCPACPVRRTCPVDR